MKKTIALLLAALLMLTLFASCSGGDEPTQPSTDVSEPSAQLTDFSVILDWYPNAFHAFLYTALEKGYFEEAGLNVTLTPPAGYSDALSFPAAGRAQAGLYYMDDVITAYVDQGMGIEIIGAATQQSLNVLIALGDSGIESPADFAGKTIGYTGSPILEAKVRQICRNAGLQDSDYTLIDIGFDIMTAITTKSVDVAAGGMLNSEVVELEHAGYDVTYWEWDEFGVPREYNTVFVVNKADYEADRTKYDAFITACQKGYADVAADPNAAIDLIMRQEDAENYALDREVQALGIARLIAVEQESGVPFLSMDKQVWNDVADWLAANDLISKTVDCSEFVRTDW